jgi:hypothetical protein
MVLNPVIGETSLNPDCLSKKPGTAARVTISP